MSTDLIWTGSHFLDPGSHTAGVLAAVDGMDVTSKDETWGDGVAAAIAGYHRLRPETVRVGAGATQVIEMLLRSLYRGLVVDVVPNFHLTATLCAQEGWRRRVAEVRRPAELMPALEAYLDDEDAIFSLSSPRNPLGYQFAVEDIAALAERARGVIIVDEVYADFAATTALSLVESRPKLVVVRTFSKAWGLANLRIGFGASALLAGPPPGGTSWRQLPNSVSGVAQRAVKHLLAHPEPVRASIDAARQTRDRLLKLFADVEGMSVWPSEANYLCLETPAPLAAALETAGYRVRRLHDLRGYPASFPAGVRISVPPPPHDDAVAEVVLDCQARFRHEVSR
ncbi:aminotransferase class I/II-fold pyridoxal phosphate-dependent enzyme [Amycolatopsis sp. YIM 10]|uniref:aminotransferase class I/II-fold pyridoxal phosphate-dependent enzyme n=1 Tax=Amycolatopsis sp. YIM 10 TaxID=2653857 RepID=UPI0012904A50|nr:aminotransferase class I/II-fold pyridoxal phosphate-dependent enzyme [Amycolatopsis sp. YIM 10]QFU91065.1 Histidinol-phosphate aminotransferase [Amycolatopsis sp. YIM 10]